MWYTVLHDEVPIGIVDLPPLALAAGAMQRLPAYSAIQPTVRAATIALLALGFYGAALPPIPPRSREILHSRRALARAARLRLSLVNERGAIAHVRFVNLLEPPGDERVVVVAAFDDAIAAVGAMMPAPTAKGRGNA